MAKKGFSPEARLKGIKKQAAGLGYELVATGSGVRAAPSESGDMAKDVELRAAKKIAQFDQGAF